jgi:ribosomal protein S14
MDLAGRAKGFLILHESTDFCDECLARALGVTAAEARQAVAALAKSPTILRDRWTCTSCGRTRDVTRAMPGKTFALGRRSRSRLPRSA